MLVIACLMRAACQVSRFAACSGLRPTLTCVGRCSAGQVCIGCERTLCTPLEKIMRAKLLEGQSSAPPSVHDQPDELGLVDCCPSRMQTRASHKAMQFRQHRAGTTPRPATIIRRPLRFLPRNTTSPRANNQAVTSSTEGCVNRTSDSSSERCASTSAIVYTRCAHRILWTPRSSSCKQHPSDAQYFSADANVSVQLT